MVLNLISGIVLLMLMVLASGVVVDVVEKMAFRLPVKKQTMAAMLVGISLALPELFVGIASALEGKPEIALGNVVGASMANLSLIIGGVAIVATAVPIVGEYLQKDLWITVGMAMLPFLMISNGKITGVEGGILVAAYFVYAFFLAGNKGIYKREKKKLEKHESWASTIMLFLGLIIMAASSWLLVQIAVRIAAVWEVSWYWVGLILIAFGTTLPELFLLLSQKKQKVSLVLPNLLGSVAVNSTLVIGLVAMMQPIAMTESFQRGLSGMFLIVILGMFWLFTKSKKKLERWEGVVLIGIYLMFVGIQMMIA